MVITMNKRVIYNGIPCELIENYYAEGDGPYLKIVSGKDVDRAYALGFSCMGYPDEVMLKISEEETEKLLTAARGI